MNPAPALSLKWLGVLPAESPAPGHGFIEVIENDARHYSVAPAAITTAEVAAALADGYAAPGMVGGRFVCLWARVDAGGRPLEPHAEFFLYYANHGVTPHQP